MFKLFLSNGDLNNCINTRLELKVQAYTFLVLSIYFYPWFSCSKLSSALLESNPTAPDGNFLRRCGFMSGYIWWWEWKTGGRTSGCSSRRSNSYFTDAWLDCTSCLMWRCDSSIGFQYTYFFPALGGQSAAGVNPSFSMGWRQCFTWKSSQFVSGTKSRWHSHLYPEPIYSPQCAWLTRLWTETRGPKENPHRNCERRKLHTVNLRTVRQQSQPLNVSPNRSCGSITIGIVQNLNSVIKSWS